MDVAALWLAGIVLALVLLPGLSLILSLLVQDAMRLGRRRDD